MAPKPSSKPTRGLFVSVDGPGGAGKTTIVRHLAQMLVAEGINIHVTAEPSTGEIGSLAYRLTEDVTGHALACLYAADRYHHVEAEILPLVRRGYTVISDRYLASGLVVQRFDGVDPVFLWQLNEEVERPDLTVILEADPDVIAERLSERGAHNRFQLAPGSAHHEAEYYRDAADELEAAGFPVLRVNCNHRAPERAAGVIRGEMIALLMAADTPMEVG